MASRARNAADDITALDASVIDFGADAAVQAIANAVWTDGVKADYKTWAETSAGI
jgi:hypothetical protein